MLNLMNVALRPTVYINYVVIIVIAAELVPGGIAPALRTLRRQVSANILSYLFFPGWPPAVNLYGSCCHVAPSIHTICLSNSDRVCRAHACPVSSLLRVYGVRYTLGKFAATDLGSAELRGARAWDGPTSQPPHATRPQPDYIAPQLHSQASRHLRSPLPIRKQLSNYHGSHPTRF